MKLDYEINIYEKDLTTTLKPSVLSDTVKLDESLDSGLLVLPRLTRKKQFNRFSIVNIKVSKDSTLVIDDDYLVYATRSDISGKGATLYYEHTLGLIEPIKWFEKFQCGTLTFTQPLEDENQKSLYDYVERLRQLVPFLSEEYRADTRLFTIDSDLIDILKEFEVSPQIYLEEKNLRQALIELFKVINAIPRINYNSTDGLWVLTADFVNNRNINIDISTDIIDYRVENDGGNYGQTAELFLENVVPDNDTEKTNVFVSSIEEFVSLRSDDIIVGESNQKLILDYSIAELKSIKLIDSNNEEIDLTPYCFEKNVYDTLEYDTDDDGEIIGTRSRAFFWSYKSNVIDGMFVGYADLFRTIDKTSIANILTFLGKSILRDYYAFKIEFVPFIENMRSKVYRIDRRPYELTTNMFDEFSTVRLNQQERLNDLFNSTKNAYGEVQRIGVDTISVSKKHYDINDYEPSTNPNGIYSVGDYTDDGFYVTKVERIFYRSFVIARYELTRNFNRIAQFIQIDKEFRPYNIGLTGNDITLKRNILIPLGIVELGITKETETLNETFRTSFMQTFDYTSADIEIPFATSVLVTSNNPNFGEVNAVLKPLQLLSEKNTLKYRLDFNNTKLAGKRRLNVEDYTLPIELNAIRNDASKQLESNYTFDNAEFEYGKICLTRNLWERMNTLNDFSVSNLEIHEIKFFISTFLPTVFNRSIISDDENNQFLYGWYVGNEFFGDFDSRGNYLDLIKVYDTYADMVAFGTATNIRKCYVTADNKLYEYRLAPVLDWVESEASLIYLENEDYYETETYAFKKDRSEILGLDLYLPILPNQDLTDNIIIGDYLSKNNTMLFEPTSGTRTLYWYVKNKPTNKMKTDKIDNVTNQFAFDLLDLNADNITVPTSIYSSYDYFALGDINKNMLFAVNQTNLDGTTTEISTIYFNFKKLEIDFDEMLFFDKTLSFQLDSELRMIRGLRPSEEITFALTSELEYIIPKKNFYTEQLSYALTSSLELVEPTKLQLDKELLYQLTSSIEKIEPTKLELSEILGFNLISSLNLIEPTKLNIDKELSYQLLSSLELIEPTKLNLSEELGYQLVSSLNVIEPTLLNLDKELGYQLTSLLEVIQPELLNFDKSLGFALTSQIDIIEPDQISFNETMGFALTSSIAVFEEYTITYNLDGGTNDALNKATFYQDDLTFFLYPASKSGFTFDGWYDNASFTGSAITQVTTIGDKTYYAKWTTTPPVDLKWTQLGSGTVGNEYTYNEALGFVSGADTSPGVLADDYALGYRVRVNDGGFPTTNYYFYVTEEDI